MKLLVLGGTNFVGRCVVEEALRRGDTVTTVTRGLSGQPPAGVQALHVDRRDSRALESALGANTWDAAIDTWSMEPSVVWDSARLLADRVRHYGYVSSRSVYGWPLPVGGDEQAPVVESEARGAVGSDYPTAKRGAELAVLQWFPGRALLTRAGLVLGPYEDVGRLPWWLLRLSRGGPVVAPGPTDRRLQYIDARDLAIWMLSSAERDLSGTFNVVSRPGHTTMGELLEACNNVVGSRAKLVWFPPHVIEAAGLSGWTDLPIWVPPTGDLAGLHDADVSAAHAAGLVCRSIAETVADTYCWLQEEGLPQPSNPDRGAMGISPEIERALLTT
jgi:2'-hydroxyisoflavone reductase